MRNLISFLIYLTLFISIISCRDDIIEPGNFAGNYNSPIQENERNYYSLVINAKDLSSDFKSSTDFSFVNNKTLLTISDITSGGVRILVKNKEGLSLYSSVNQSDIINYTRKLSGSIPHTVEIYFSNFSGKLKFSLTYSPE
jgi:hypothetical protein